MKNKTTADQRVCDSSTNISPPDTVNAAGESVAEADRCLQMCRRSSNLFFILGF